MVSAIHNPLLLYRLIRVTTIFGGALVEVPAMPVNAAGPQHMAVARREAGVPIVVAVSPQGHITRKVDDDARKGTAQAATAVIESRATVAVSVQGHITRKAESTAIAHSFDDDILNGGAQVATAAIETYSVSVSGGSSCTGADGNYTFSTDYGWYANADTALFSCAGNTDPNVCYLVLADGMQQLFKATCAGACGASPPTTGWEPVASNCAGATLTLNLTLSDSSQLTPTTTAATMSETKTPPTTTATVKAGNSDTKNNTYAVLVSGGSSCTGIDGSYTYNPKYDKYAHGDTAFFSCAGNTNPNTCYLVRVDGMQQLFQATCGGACGVNPPTTGWEPVTSGCLGATLTTTISEAAPTTTAATKSDATTLSATTSEATPTTTDATMSETTISPTTTAATKIEVAPVGTVAKSGTNVGAPGFVAALSGLLVLTK